MLERLRRLWESLWPDPARTSLTWWLAAIHVALVLLVAGGITWSASRMLRELADAQGKARVQLAQDNLPNGGQPGFELFDSKSLGSTDFEQKVKYQRALEGEIARTIDRLHVEGTRAYASEMARHGWRTRDAADVTVRRYWTLALGIALERSGFDCDSLSSTETLERLARQRVVPLRAEGTGHCVRRLGELNLREI